MKSPAQTNGSRRALAAATAVALAATLATGVSGPASADEPLPEPHSLGHIAYADGELTLDADRPAQEHVIEIPDGRAADALAPGWDTTGVPDGAVDQDTVRWSLTGLEGPGDLRVYEAPGEPGSTPVFDSTDGLPDAHALPTGQQGATHWTFSADGTYTATLTARATTLDGRRLSADTHYTVLVGDEAVEDARETPELEAEAPTPQPSEPSQPAARPLVTAAASPFTRTNKEPTKVTAKTAADSDVATDKKVLDEGHIDFAARVIGRRLQIHVKDGTVSGKTTWREPSSVVLHVKSAARKTLPSGKDFAFLGKAGDPVWLLDQVQQEGLLWPGWSTDNIAAGAAKGGVEFSLTAVEGPGAYALYTYDAMSGADVLFNSKDGVPDSFDVAANTHAHGGWAFTKEGTYRLTFRMRGKLADGTAVSDTETVAFVVGDEDPSKVTPGGESTAKDGASTDRHNSNGDSSTPEGSSSQADGSQGAKGSMASTGAPPAALLGAAAAALATLGGVAVITARRRRTRTTEGGPA
ncbi:TIGR03773 family transporter-associated surface protein [Streptomyces sp. NPDC058067]|uniref:TIGR03773 family transporter-associated surface protein n=1 Tax=Streptomyces sp. NPDC058067 TaxID=3346324 RepID=UPI0036E0EFAD